MIGPEGLTSEIQLSVVNMLRIEGESRTSALVSLAVIAGRVIAAEADDGGHLEDMIGNFTEAMRWFAMEARENE